MPAGREMDALVAERVMGCKPEPWLDFHGYKSYRCTCLLSYPHNSQTGPMADLDLKSYSNDIAAAWDVVEKLTTEKQFWFGLRFHNDDEFQLSSHIWEATFQDFGRGFGETAPLAVCRAALKTVMK